MRMKDLLDTYITESLATGGLPSGVTILQEIDAVGSPAPSASTNPAPSTGSTGTTTWTKETAPAHFASASGRHIPPAQFSAPGRTIPPAVFAGNVPGGQVGEDEDDEVVAAVLQDLQNYSDNVTEIQSPKSPHWKKDPITGEWKIKKDPPGIMY